MEIKADRRYFSKKQKSTLIEDIIYYKNLSSDLDKELARLRKDYQQTDESYRTLMMKVKTLQDVCAKLAQALVLP